MRRLAIILAALSGQLLIIFFENEKWNLDVPQESPWSIKQIVVDNEIKDPKTRGVAKDAIIFKNGVKIEDLAFQLKYLDAFPYREELTYLFQGSPCQDCDGIRSLYILNPLLGKAKLAFIPGVYYSTLGNQQVKEFEGEVYYGNCLDEEVPAIYLHKIDYKADQSREEKIVESKSLLMIQPFQENYRTKKLEFERLRDIKSAYRSFFKKCFKITKQNRIIIPL